MAGKGPGAGAERLARGAGRGGRWPLRGWAVLTVGSIGLWFLACGFLYFRGTTNGFFFAAATMPALVGWYCYHFADDFKRKLFSPDFASGMFWAACLGTLGMSTGTGFAESDDLTALTLLGAGFAFATLGAVKVLLHAKKHGPRWRLNDVALWWVVSLVGISLLLGILAGFAILSAKPHTDACKASEDGAEACSSAATRMAFGKAAFPEELFKWFFVWSVPRFRGRNMMEMARTRRALSQRLVLYSVTISLGFSMTENLLLFSSMDPGQFEGNQGSNWMYTLWLLRAALLTPMHALAGSITALGRARVLYHPSSTIHGSSVHKTAWDIAVQLFHFSVAVTMHAIYDFWAYWNELSMGKPSNPGDAFTIQALYWTVSLFFLAQRFLCMGVTVDTLRAQLYRGSGENVEVPFVPAGRLEPDPHFADGMKIMRLVRLNRKSEEGPDVTGLETGGREGSEVAPGSTSGGRTGVAGGGGVGGGGGADSEDPGGLIREKGAVEDDSEAMQACSLTMRAVSAAEKAEEQPQARSSSVVIRNPLTAAEGEDDGWSEQIAETGHVYYYNALTGETQWEPPPRFATQDSVQVP